MCTILTWFFFIFFFYVFLSFIDHSVMDFYTMLLLHELIASFQFIMFMNFSGFTINSRLLFLLCSWKWRRVTLFSSSFSFFYQPSQFSFFFLLLLFHPFLFFSELVLKVRVANTDDPDFIEIDFPITHMNFSHLLTVCCKELAVNPQMVERIRYTRYRLTGWHWDWVVICCCTLSLQTSLICAPHPWWLILREIRSILWDI